MSRGFYRLVAGIVAVMAMTTLSGSTAPTRPHTPATPDPKRRPNMSAFSPASKNLPTQRDGMATIRRRPAMPRPVSLREDASTKGIVPSAVSARGNPMEPAPALRRTVTPTGATTTGPRLRVFSRPALSSTSQTIATKNPIDQRLVLLVNRTAKNGRWLRVLLPERPNGSTAWVRSDAVELVKLHQRIVVDLSDRTLKHFRGGRLVNEFVVGIGTQETPTPRGTFYVWARVPQPDSTGPYGNYALGLSGFSPVLTDWPGGGRSAVHGTSRSSDRGRAVSHGCVRVYNADMRRLMQVPMGTPVHIRK